VKKHYKATQAQGFNWLNLELYSVVENSKFDEVK